MRQSTDHEQFVDDDEGYLRWIKDHPNGLVVNSNRSPSSSYIVLHRASCKQVNTPNRANWTTTGYIKTCSTDLASLADWARRETGGEVAPCKICKPSTPDHPGSTAHNRRPEGDKRPATPQERASDYRTTRSEDGRAWVLDHKALLTWLAATVVTALLCPLLVEFIKSRSGLFNENRPAAV